MSLSPHRAINKNTTNKHNLLQHIITVTVYNTNNLIHITVCGLYNNVSELHQCVSVVTFFTFIYFYFL